MGLLRNAAAIDFLQTEGAACHARINHTWNHMIRADPHFPWYVCYCWKTCSDFFYTFYHVFKRLGCLIENKHVLSGAARNLPHIPLSILFYNI